MTRWEDVAGGGIREIVAGVTLAAMTMTGSPVSAFGLAKAMAEGPDALIEEAPRELASLEIEVPAEEVAIELGGDEAEVNLDEGLEAAAAGVYDALSASAPEQAVDQVLDEALAETDEAPEYDQASAEAMPEEAVLKLGEDGIIEMSGEMGAEAAAVEESAEDREALMNDLINTAIEARADEGVYAALDCAFSTLAENAAFLADPETGVIEADGNQIVSMTFDALESRFEYEPEQLMGAIGAAAYRADERGDLQALGGDQALVLLAAASESDSNATLMKYAKAYFDSTMSAIALAYPSFKVFVPFLTSLSGDIFSTGGNANAAILSKLDDIDRHLQSTEDSLKRNTYNVVSLQAIGDKYSQVANKAEHIQEMIGNITGNSALTDAQKLQKLADLTDNSEFSALESAMDGATRCFTSNVNDIFERQSIFEAAYAKASETVMFSSEAIDISMPYIVRQFATYAAAYGVMSQVYDAHEQVYGANSLTATRQKMLQRLGGIDAYGNKVDGTVADQIKAYLSRDRYIFINKGTSNIALDRAILVRKFDYNGNVNTADPFSNSVKNAIKSEISSIPLNDKQVEAISSYAAGKGRCLFDFLFNDMHFAPLYSGSGKLGNDPRPFKNLGMSKGFDGVPLNPKIKTEPTNVDDTAFINSYQLNFNYGFNEETQNFRRPSIVSRRKLFVVDGKQTLKYTIDDHNRMHYVKAYLLNALNVGAKYESQKNYL